VVRICWFDKSFDFIVSHIYYTRSRIMKSVLSVLYWSFPWILCVFFASNSSVVYSQGGYVEEGIASYYGDAFAGRKTANGEIFDPEAFTAAHKTLPLGTYVKVTNLANRQGVVVKINDRGPFQGNRIIDLSKAAAKEIDMFLSGTTRVKIEEIVRLNLKDKNKDKPVNYIDLSGNEEPTEEPLEDTTKIIVPGAKPVESAEPIASKGEDEKETKGGGILYSFSAKNMPRKGYGVQVASYAKFQNVLEAADELRRKGVKNLMVHASYYNTSPIFRLIVGPYTDKPTASKSKGSLTSKGLKGLVVSLDNLK